MGHCVLLCSVKGLPTECKSDPFLIRSMPWSELWPTEVQCMILFLSKKKFHFLFCKRVYAFGELAACHHSCPVLFCSVPPLHYSSHRSRTGRQQPVSNPIHDPASTWRCPAATLRPLGFFFKTHTGDGAMEATSMDVVR